ncbi:MAG: hypothetical protein LBT23_01140 [Synergistaceae bacterium]|jgi:diaminopimelate epimerase|nr:hypothetical protein [Synergistaceae bacterium]
MEIEFVKINPTQNMTILVESPVERRLQRTVAGLLMSYEGVYAEQVGYIERPFDDRAWGRLRMAGGEFCGNAAMSLAAYLAWKRELAGGSEVSVFLEASGAEGLIECDVRAGEDSYACTLSMPLPERIDMVTLPVAGVPRDFTAVWLPGITHIMASSGDVGDDMRAWAERAAEEWKNEIESEAFGIMMLDEASCRIDPLVCVKSSGTLVWERGCGSGSAAVGAYMARKASRSSKSMVSQPGGVITVGAEYSEGKITALSITGNVKIVARGVAYL